MCKGKCKCKANDEQKMICIEESKYLFSREMHAHYKELYETSVNELRFKSMNVQHLLSLFNECAVLLENKRPHTIISKVIENGIEKHNIDINIHNSQICDWQYNFSDNIGNENLEEEYDDDYDNEEDDNCDGDSMQEAMVDIMEFAKMRLGIEEDDEDN